MYNYDFGNEKVIYESVENLISINNKEGISNIIITKSKLLIFNNIRKNTILSGRGIQEMPEYEILIELDLNKLSYEIDEENTIIEFNDNEIILYDFDLNKVKISSF